MVAYAREGEVTKSCKARGSDLRVHFKNMRETAMAIKNMEFNAAKKYLEDVIAMRRCIVFRRFCGGVGRTAQAKNEGSTNGQGRWPKKSAEMLLGILKNAESNAEVRRAASRSLAGFFRGRRTRAKEGCPGARGVAASVQTRAATPTIRSRTPRPLASVIASSPRRPRPPSRASIPPQGFRLFPYGNQSRSPPRQGFFFSTTPSPAEPELTSSPLPAPSPQVKGLDVDALSVYHIQVNRAIQQRRRTYRAHGRINPYMSSPCHVEVVLSEKVESVKKEAEPARRMGAKEAARARALKLKNGSSNA